MKKYFWNLLIYFIGSSAFGQTFITLDSETNEFIDNVNFSIYNDGQLIKRGVTLSDQPTTIKMADFDSIRFTRIDYETAVLNKGKLDTIIYLKKHSIALNDVLVINNKTKQIILGENNRIVKSQSRPISRELLEGVIFRNTTDASLLISSIIISVSKVKHKTKYKINFFDIQESKAKLGNQILYNNKIIFSSDTLILLPGDKDKIEIHLDSKIKITKNKNILVSIQLIDYYDTNDHILRPKKDQFTRLNYQLSNKLDFYAKLINFNSGELTENLRNINLMINYDFANSLYKKPHKSILVSPAILLYVTEE